MESKERTTFLKYGNIPLQYTKIHVSAEDEMNLIQCPMPTFLLLSL